MELRQGLYFRSEIAVFKIDGVGCGELLEALQSLGYGLVQAASDGLREEQSLVESAVGALGESAQAEVTEQGRHDEQPGENSQAEPELEPDTSRPARASAAQHLAQAVSKPSRGPKHPRSSDSS